ncbi:unnamed protein product [Paramecium sonneborni]|uniref:Uncharacterized protein n=1 Tax=Paramecium sonneborni TaxID=65129 RepID=A0A8S1RJK3_9CILI|nr:unnamed protein product [Paramecium sonneborni]
MIKKKDIILLKQFLNQENHPYFKYTIKQRILQIFQQIFKDQDISHVQVIINSILHIQWSLGDEIINTQFNIQNQNCLNSKYKWKMIKFYDNQKITNLSQLKKQQIFFQIKQLQKCLTKKSDLEILNKIINQIRLDLRSIYEEYSPICDVHPISFINSTSVDETLQYQEKLDKIIVSQENSEFDNDKFEQLLNKKKIEKRTYQKKFNFVQFSKYLDIFYNLNQKENVIIVNNKNYLYHKITGFHLITMLQEKNYQEDDKKYNYNSMKNQQRHQNNNDQLKKARQLLKQNIEKEIKQQQQLSLQNEQDHQTNMILDFLWAKEETINFDKIKKLEQFLKNTQNQYLTMIVEYNLKYFNKQFLINNTIFIDLEINIKIHFLI